MSEIQEGRQIESPDNNKENALKYLAILTEHIPDPKAATNVLEAVLVREWAQTPGSTRARENIHLFHSLSGSSEKLTHLLWLDLAPRGTHYSF